MISVHTAPTLTLGNSFIGSHYRKEGKILYLCTEHPLESSLKRTAQTKEGLQIVKVQGYRSWFVKRNVRHIHALVSLSGLAVPPVCQTCHLQVG